MKVKVIFLSSIIFILLISCYSQENKEILKSEFNDNSLKEKFDTIEIQQFINNNPDDGSASVSKGSVSNGTLINGKLLPFSGNNFQYFSDESFLKGRAFVHSKVKKIVIDSYKSLEYKVFDHLFYIMESSNKCGGKLDPHKTHQNGTSIDFMMPLTKNGKDFIGLDTIGVTHYFLTFDNKGRNSEDTLVKINFDLVALHILELNKVAKENGMKIGKVIIKLELKDELFASLYGKELISSGIYFAQKLTPLINSVHDEHYHIDFEFVN